MARKPRHLTERRAFALLLDGHLKRGQRMDGAARQWKPWTNNDFAGFTGVSPNSVANWRNPDAPIPPTDINPVLEALFGDKPEHANHRRDLKEAWERAQGLLPPEEEPETGDGWDILGGTAPTTLAEAILHQPKADNRADTWHLHATLRFGPAEQHTQEGHTVIVGVTETFAALTLSGYQVAPNSLLGERAPHDHVIPGVGGVTLTGPTRNDALHGNPIGEDHLATIEPGPAGEGTVKITLSASPRALTFAYAPDPDAPLVCQDQKPNRAAILGLLFAGETPRDAQGRVVLASAGLRRKSAP